MQNDRVKEIQDSLLNNIYRIVTDTLYRLDASPLESDQAIATLNLSNVRDAITEGATVHFSYLNVKHLNIENY